MTGTSIKTSSMKELLKSFEEQLGRKLTADDVATVKLDKIDPLPLSGKFDISLGTTQDLNDKIAKANINKSDISLGSEQNTQTNKPKFGR